MLTYILVSLGSGLLFGVLDGLIHGNPWAQKLLEAFKPIAKDSVNAPAGIAIDLVFGFVMAGLYLLLYKSLPGSAGWTKGLSFGLLAWFFRVLMSAASQWMMFNVPVRTLSYLLLAGLVEMLVIGLLYGLTLRPAN